MTPPRPFTAIEVDRRGPVERLWLARPEVRNAFNEVLIDDLARWAEAARSDSGVRAVVLGGRGKAFSAGADLAWMARTAEYTREQNLDDARRLAALFEVLDSLSFPLIGRVHGAALGGGAGLAAVCDVVVAADDTVFGFTEVRLGILPAVIAPYVVAKIGMSAARELFLTGSRFSAARAREIGLAHAVVPAGELEATIEAYVGEVLAGGREAIGAAKHLLREIACRRPPDAAPLTSGAIAERRTSAEGQEGLRAFLEKRRPAWSETRTAPAPDSSDRGGRTS